MWKRKVRKVNRHDTKILCVQDVILVWFIDVHYASASQAVNFLGWDGTQWNAAARPMLGSLIDWLIPPLWGPFYRWLLQNQHLLGWWWFPQNRLANSCGGLMQPRYRSTGWNWDGWFDSLNSALVASIQRLPVWVSNFSSCMIHQSLVTNERASWNIDAAIRILYAHAARVSLFTPLGTSTSRSTVEASSTVFSTRDGSMGIVSSYLACPSLGESRKLRIYILSDKRFE